MTIISYIGQVVLFSSTESIISLSTLFISTIDIIPK